MLEKGLKSERQAAQSRLARNTGCRRCSVGVHARPRLEFNWCDEVCSPPSGTRGHKSSGQKGKRVEPGVHHEGKKY